MNKKEHIKANKEWLEAKAKEDGVKKLSKGIYFKFLREDMSFLTIASEPFSCRE